MILLTGLVAIAWDGLNAGTGQAVWLGDLAFIAAGTMWGTFTTLLKRWRVDAVSATAVVSVFSMVVFVPGYLIIYGLPQLPAQALASQAVFQGLLGGCFGVIAYGMTVTSLGAGRAALFPALVPAAATLIAVPLLGQVPGGLQFAGILLSSLGLLTAFVLSGSGPGCQSLRLKSRSMNKVCPHRGQLTWTPTASRTSKHGSGGTLRRFETCGLPIGSQ